MASHPSRANALSLALSLLSLSPPPHSHTPYHSKCTTPGLEKSYTLIGPQWGTRGRVVGALIGCAEKGGSGRAARTPFLSGSALSFIYQTGANKGDTGRRILGKLRGRAEAEAEGGERRVAMRINKRGEGRVRGGFPWVFEDEIKRVSHEGKAGDVVILFDRNDKFLGVGLLSEKNGRIRVRVLSLKRVKVDQEWLTTRGIRAAQKRHFLFPNPGRTNAYRVVNGENDGLGGFVCDKYNDTLVIKLYSASWFRYLESMVDGLSSSIPGTNRVVLLLSRGLQGLSVEERNGYENAQTLRGDKGSGWVRFIENGIAFQCDPYNGQKTGFFLDQRENRERVEELSEAKRVLNVFSYTGAFSLYAARGGAREVYSLDINRHAMAEAERNFALNKDSFQTAHHTIVGDAFQKMQELINSNQRFDVVIVDPPSMASNKKHIDRAINAYSKLAQLAVRLVSPKGCLVFASCSAKIAPEEFFSSIERAAFTAGRRMRVIQRTGHAKDHAFTFREGQYLKCMFARLD